MYSANSQPFSFLSFWKFFVEAEISLILSAFRWSLLEEKVFPMATQMFYFKTLAPAVLSCLSFFSFSSLSLNTFICQAYQKRTLPLSVCWTSQFQLLSLEVCLPLGRLSLCHHPLASGLCPLITKKSTAETRLVCDLGTVLHCWVVHREGLLWVASCGCSWSSSVSGASFCSTKLVALVKNNFLIS